MKGKDFKLFLEALDELEKEKGISKEKLFETIESAIFAAYKKNFGEDKNVKVEIDRSEGDIIVYGIKTVVENVEDEAMEISLADAASFVKGRKGVNIGDEVKVEIKCDEFRRNAIQNAKQIVIQRVREAERENIFNNFKAKEGDLVNGIIRRIDEKGNVYIEIASVEAVLTVAEQSPLDRYRVGERIKVYVVEVEQTSKFPKIVISRKHEGLLKKVFETEIPEIEEGIIVIKAVAREAGSRAKIAIYSENTDIDKIGACIGQKGLRIKAVGDALNGEKIDIVEWKEDMVEFVSAALSPAKVKSVEIIEEGTTARVIVPENQLSLAIGKNGQNARLAAKLTSMRIDIKTVKEESVDEEQ